MAGGAGAKEREKGGVGWKKIEEEWGVVSGENGEGSVPEGRYASQVVYDPLLREHYMSGSHPGVNDPNCAWRLDDFWKLKIVDPSPEEALRMAKFLHAYKPNSFIELCATSPTVLALSYLQTSLSSVIDHSSPTESSAFRACMAAVLAAPARFDAEVDIEMDGSFTSLAPYSYAADAGERYGERHELWEKLCGFFPRRERQPEEDLEDTGRLVRVWKKGGGTLAR
ncbi:hypothetical protein JCM8547_008721 [Rhodosporidiobolus lusitaniae]